MDDLKAKAAPKFERLAKEASDQNAKLDVCIVLLDRLCTLKEAQQDGEDNRHEDWQNSKIRDMRAALWVLGVAVVGVSLDFIKVDSEGRFITWLINMFL